MNFRVKAAILEKGAETVSFTQRALSRLQGDCAVGWEMTPSPERLEGYEPEKETVRFLTFPGGFLKPCPGTREYLCCGYQILNIGTNCPLDCSYCVLQAYFNQPGLRIFVNLEERLEAIGEAILNSGRKVIRIGTGEFTDSLALDPIVKWTQVLPRFVSQHRKMVLEFKTKTVSIEGLLSSPQRDRIVVSWSLNSPSIAATEEHGAPSIRKRLEAARTCQREGYSVGFHFDPLIEHASWKEDYARTVDFLDRYVLPSKVVWISLGCLRFMPSLKGVIRRRFPGTRILDGEFIPGLDGKMRYIKPVRTEMYYFMKEKLAHWGMGKGVYLCMESGDVWEKGLGWSPENSEELSAYLDGRAVSAFGLE